MFDELSDLKIHYVEIFAATTTEEEFEAMLICASLLQKGDLSEPQHKLFENDTMQVCNKDGSNVVLPC